MDNPEIVELIKRLASILWRLILVLYLANMFKGFARGIAIKCWLFFNKNVIVDKFIHIDGIEGYIRNVGFWETKIEVEKGEKTYNYFVPNDRLLHSIKGFPIYKEKDKNKD